jgi:hypothetical protein
MSCAPQAAGWEQGAAMPPGRNAKLRPVDKARRRAASGAVHGNPTLAAVPPVTQDPWQPAQLATPGGIPGPFSKAAYSGAYDLLPKMLFGRKGQSAGALEKLQPISEHIKRLL